MHPHCFYSCSKREPTLEELKAKVMEINDAIECIAECDLSVSVKDLAIDELKAKKEVLKELMRQKVDEL